MDLVQRIIPNTSHLFELLENIIREKFIPALVGRKISDIERKILALPVRYGGIGLTNPVHSAENEMNTQHQSPLEKISPILYLIRKKT